MSILNRLPEEALRGADRAFSWLMILFGYIIAMALALDPAGWDDPVFTVLRELPYMPLSWAATLTVTTTIYMVGEIVTPDTYRRRGAIAICGAVGCGAWALGMSLMMTRMVYLQPTRITVLWPLVMFFVSVLFFARAIVYANAFTARRWNTNPYQMWGTMFLLSSSLAQVIIGVAPSSVFTEVQRPVQIQLALVNLLGASIVIFGLHLRNKDIGMNLEMSGTASLVITLGWYCAAAIHHNILAGTTLGFALCEAFVFASLHRAIEIIILRLAQRRGAHHTEAKMAHMIDPLPWYEPWLDERTRRRKTPEPEPTNGR